MLKTTQEIHDFFLNNRRRLFYVSTSTHNLLGSDDWIANLTFINSVDSFNGRHPHVFTAVPSPGEIAPGIEAANNYLLAQPGVAEHVRSAHADRPGVLFLMFDEHTERLAEALNLTVALPPARLRQRLDSKITTTRLANQAGVAQVPNILARVDSYQTLREVSRELGPDLVVQLPWGDSGATTFFISTESDYLPHAARISAQPEVKIMRRIRCRQFTIEGCVTRHGILAGPLQTDLVGLPELTPFAGGWCGNEVFAPASSRLITTEMRREAQRSVIAMGRQLREEGYWGVFGLDLLLDQDTGALYLGEMNPRITGATPLSIQAARERRQPPLILFHLLEWMGVDFSLDMDALNQVWIDPGPAGDWGQLIVEHVGGGSGVLNDKLPRTGIWQMEPDGQLTFARESFRTCDVSGDNETYLVRTLDPGHTVSDGYSIVRLTLRQRLLDDDYRLTTRAAAWLRAFRRLLDAATE